ncbi:MAG: nucleoid occlusion factor SlmA [Thiobacillaceae bacterium]|nr:nucleoid occlusion factor SlmA [Thiobacillaceae bacterium]MCX7672111.1 nucleoid occlusion factor SlmA [Thiobacillaceae bacterium]MDW8323137.1 nucleoid occlusion factor SlmA [Burkholderiales bacterium]
MSRPAGERRQQILEALAQMLEAPQPEKITTAALAQRLAVSEAALYRHFASKAQMYEGLIAFIEEALFSRINRIVSEEPDGLAQVRAILTLLLAFAEKNPGMTRVLLGEALVHEHERLLARVTQLHERLEASLRQSLRIAASQAEPAAAPELSAARANLLMSFVLGRWHQFVRSGFRRAPTEHWRLQSVLLLGG